jgi:mannose-6-phosphate isomerase-like protein (cupin superfamily)
LQGEPARVTDEVAVVAPDGIVVHPIALPGLAGLTLAEGRLRPGEFGPHAHRSLEQITYVLAGRVIVTMGDPRGDATVELDCGPGDTVSTPPLATLSFRNPGPDLARVLFICAPPYPADDADTAGLDRHRALGPDELRAAVARVRVVRAEVDARFAAQLAGLEALLGRAE